MAQMVEHVVGLDHGNGWVKVWGARKCLVFPSYIADLEKVGTTYNDVADLKLNEYTDAEYKKETYVWGEDVKQVQGAISTYSQNNRYANKFYQLVSLFAIYEALGTGKKFDNVLVVTGVPTDEKGTPAEQELIESLIGTHIINGKKIEIVEVVVLPQPLGTVMSLYLDNDGYIKDSKYQTAKIGIIDVGTGTTDLDVIYSLRRQDSHKSITYGMMDIFTNVATYLKKKAVSIISIPKIEEGWKLGVYKESERHVTSFGEYKRKAVEDVFKYISEGISLLWKNLKIFDILILTGGGAMTFKSHFDKYIDDIYDIPEKPQTANVEGFYNYGKYIQAVKNGE
ncbi:MAG TPA: plasmid segregation protein ParM [Pseudoneobacillus sp.]|nr:plasmid segregation protein ParM [Pseudoneobacillus sp.]